MNLAFSRVCLSVSALDAMRMIWFVLFFFSFFLNFDYRHVSRIWLSNNNNNVLKKKKGPIKTRLCAYIYPESFFAWVICFYFWVIFVYVFFFFFCFFFRFSRNWVNSEV